MKLTSGNITGGKHHFIKLIKFNFSISNMPYFRKKPIVVEAVQIQHEVKVDTLEGQMVGNPGDYIVIGIKGERYPVNRDIFEKTYEQVENPNL